ncbi:MAG: DUF5320 domain-containing protein [Pirellulales bacterium]|nr:DUF5320 domain-containing protein [Pirellulales bacterium]
MAEDREVDKGKDADKTSNHSFERSLIMPGGDRTGPMGQGPMTGRGAGYCAGYPVPGTMNGPGRGFGRGFGRGGGFGGGRGWRHRFYATGLTGWQRAAAAVPPVAPAQPVETREEEIALLRQQAEMLGSSLEQIKQRLDELQSPASTGN